MADVYSTEYAAVWNTTPPTKQEAALFNGRVRCQFITYEALSLAAASVIYMTHLQPGHAILPMSCLVCDDLESGPTLQVGDYYADATSSDDDDRYLAATVFTTAGQQTFLNNIAGVGYKLEYEADIIITTAVDEITGTVEMCLLYSGA